MAHYGKTLALAMALVLAFSAVGCTTQKDETSAEAQPQLWVVDNAKAPQEGYVMENPSASGDLLTPVTVKNLGNSRTSSEVKKEDPEEVKAIWLSYLDLKPMPLTTGDKSV